MDFADWQENYKVIKMSEYETKYRNPPAGFIVENGETIYLWNIVFKGNIYWEYYVDQHGNPWSAKKKYFQRLSPNVSGKSVYPKIVLYNKGKKLTIPVHQLVCETFHIIPLPSGVTEIEWNKTPESVKKHFVHYWQVNHINHIHTDFHPDNLEWVSGQENVDKYHEHRLAA